VHDICFKNGADDIEKMRELGIVVEEFGSDDLQKQIYESEVIAERNFVTELL